MVKILEDTNLNVVVRIALETDDKGIMNCGRGHTRQIPSVFVLCNKKLILQTPVCDRLARQSIRLLTEVSLVQVFLWIIREKVHPGSSLFSRSPGMY